MMSMRYKNLIVIEQTATALVLKKGDPQRSYQFYGVKLEVLLPIVLVIAVGIWTIHQHNQRGFYGNTNLLLHWWPIILTILVSACVTVTRLGAVTHEIWTFDRIGKVFRQEAYSSLGKRVRSQSLEQFADVELIELRDEGHQLYGINLLSSQRKKQFLGWSSRYMGQQAAINLHHYRQLTQQIRDFLWPEHQGQPILDTTTGQALAAPLSAIADDQAAAIAELKTLGGLIFSNKAKKQSKIDTLQQMLLKSPNDPDLHWEMAMTLCMSRKTQFDAIPYLHQAKQLYSRQGDVHRDRLAMIDKGLQQLERQQNKGQS